MSRSYKKTPGFTDQQRHSKTPSFFKQQANKKVRKFDGMIPNGKAYRKLYEPYEICDWKFLHYSDQELHDWHYRTSRFFRIFTPEPLYRYYMK